MAYQNHINLDCAHLDEFIALNRNSSNWKQVIRQTEQYIAAIKKCFGKPPGSSLFRIDELPHDLGPYPQMRFYYEAGDPDERAYAHLCAEYPIWMLKPSPEYIKEMSQRKEWFIKEFKEDHEDDELIIW